MLMHAKHGKLLTITYTCDTTRLQLLLAISLSWKPGYFCRKMSYWVTCGALHDVSKRRRELGASHRLLQRAMRPQFLPIISNVNSAVWLFAARIDCTMYCSTKYKLFFASYANQSICAIYPVSLALRSCTSMLLRHVTASCGENGATWCMHGAARLHASRILVNVAWAI